MSELLREVAKLNRKTERKNQVYKRLLTLITRSCLALSPSLRQLSYCARACLCSPRFSRSLAYSILTSSAAEPPNSIANGRAYVIQTRLSPSMTGLFYTKTARCHSSTFHILVPIAADCISSLMLPPDNTTLKRHPMQKALSNTVNHQNF